MKHSQRWRKSIQQSNTKHSYSSHLLYYIWQQMKQRCYNPKHKRYKDWGARGIQICDEWKNDAGAFIEWCIKNGWRQGLFLDRINNNENYTPANCRFSTPAESNSNKRSTRRLEINGELLTAQEIWIKYQPPVNLKAFLRRIGASGWSVQKAITEPKRLWVNSTNQKLESKPHQ